SECDARCSASHCWLIQPRLAEFTPPGTRSLGMMTTAINAMTMPTMNSIWFTAFAAHNDPDRRHGDCLCACAQRIGHEECRGDSARCGRRRAFGDRPCWPATFRRCPACVCIREQRDSTPGPIL